jgi:hypothetical protein
MRTIWYDLICRPLAISLQSDFGSGVRTTLIADLPLTPTHLPE